MQHPRARLWLALAAVTTIAWGACRAFEIPKKAGFPATPGYSVWALTMVPWAVVALCMAGWTSESDARSVGVGTVAGVLGAGGQLVLLQVLRTGRAYLVLPIVSLYRVIPGRFWLPVQPWLYRRFA